jgi:hypothetical protein
MIQRIGESANEQISNQPGLTNDQAGNQKSSIGAGYGSSDISFSARVYVGDGDGGVPGRG